MRRATGEFDVFNPAFEFTRRVFEGFAVLFADHQGNRRFVFLKQLLEAVHHLRAFGRWRVAPGRKRRLGGLNGLLQSRCVSQSHLLAHRARGRVVNVGGAASALNPHTVDQMRNDTAHYDSPMPGKQPLPGRIKWLRP